MWPKVKGAKRVALTDAAKNAKSLVVDRHGATLRALCRSVFPRRRWAARPGRDLDVGYEGLSKVGLNQNGYGISVCVCLCGLFPRVLIGKTQIDQSGAHRNPRFWDTPQLSHTQNDVFPPTLLGVLEHICRSSEARGPPLLARAPRPVPKSSISQKSPPKCTFQLFKKKGETTPWPFHA